MQGPRLTVGIATHKSYKMPHDDSYLPIHVGKSLNPDVELGFCTDNTGDNISHKNAKYSELTGLYWLWKNCDADYKGLVHYRRHFASPKLRKRLSRDRFNRIATKEEFTDILEEANLIVPRKRHYVIESIRNHYGHTFSFQELDCLRDAVAKFYPEYLPAFARQMNSRSAHMFNMFIMRKDLFDHYCNWLFTLLEAVEATHDDSAYTPFQKRYLGRLSEILLDVWLETNGHSPVELPIASPEPVHWGKKILGFVSAKFFGKKYEESF